MKKLHLLIAAFLLLTTYSVGQVSSYDVNYQGVVRDGNGAIMANQNVSVKLLIHETTANGIIVYEEDHNVTTSDYGVFDVKIGRGMPVLGDFTTIDWGLDVYFLETQVDENGGNNFVSLGTSQLVAVPYALRSKTAATADNVFSGDYNDLLNQPTNLSDFNNDPGFITNPDDADADATNELQTLNITGTDLNISNGNSVDLSPYFPSYWDVIRDADDDTKIETEAQNDGDYFLFTAGGDQIMLLDNRSLHFPSNGGNILIGKDAGLSDNLGPNNNNIYIGDEAGQSNVSSQFNLGIGSGALNSNTAGSNIGIGHGSLYLSTTGNLNIGLGVYAMSSNTSGSRNLALGNSSLRNNTTGSNNVILGNNAYYNNNGNENTIIGSYAGYQSPSTSSGNVFIGYRAGYYETGSNKLIIANDWGGSDILINGDFSTKKVTIDNVLRLQPRGSAPGSPVQGELYVGTDNHIYCYLGGVWKQLD